MKSLTTLWSVLADEMAGICRTSASVDSKTVHRRTEEEGVSFLTLTLPAFGKHFDACLESGKVDNSSFPGFRYRCGLPAFLRGFLCQIFSPFGVLKDDPSIEAIYAVRQLTALYGKILLPCSEERVSGAIKGFVSDENDVKRYNERFTAHDFDQLSTMADLLFRPALTHMDQLCWSGELAGRHGPGVTADRLLGNEKYDLTYWPQRLENVFPYGDHALPNWRFNYRLDRVHHAADTDEIPVRIITVPKTLKAPRIIAVEPTSMQFIQQAIARPLVECLEADSVPQGRNIASGMLGFTDQAPNRELARIGSIDGSLATIDLSSASDRVSSLHVGALLHGSPHFSEAVFACRSTKAAIPGYGVTPLAKFASMGSALCFPIEAMVFLAIAMIGIQDDLERPLTRKDVLSLRGRVRVYGDDIIVPVEHVQAVVSALTRFNMRVNGSKSFWTGLFRESCGGDYYAGEWVTPIRFRRPFPESRDDAPGVGSIVSFRNQLYKAGLWKTSKFLDTWISKKLIHFPLIGERSELLGRFTFLPLSGEKLSTRTHTPVSRGWVLRSKSPVSTSSGEGALLKCLLPHRALPFEDAEHLQRQGRPEAVGLKLRWRSVN